MLYFRFSAKWLSYTYIYSFSDSFLISVFTECWIDFPVLCCPCWLSIAFPLEAIHRQPTCPLHSSPGNRRCLLLEDHYQGYRQASCCVIVQAPWLFTVDNWLVVLLILMPYFREAGIFTTGINWAFSVCRLDTGDWKITSMDVLPATVILEVLIPTCKSVKWVRLVAVFLNPIPIT